MKVRICYTVHADDRYRRAIRYHYGESGPATREEVRTFCMAHGGTSDDDILFELDEAEEAKEQQP